MATNKAKTSKSAKKSPKKPIKKTAAKAEKKAAADEKAYDLSYTQNRELSWLRFDARVLDEAYDASVPLFERLKFTSIFESNLFEFFMVRIGGLSDLAELKHQPVDNKSGLTPEQQIDLVLGELPAQLKRWTSIFHTLEKKLDKAGVHRAQPGKLSIEEKTFVQRYFQAYVSPVISPLVIDPRHPFPNLRNGALYVVCGIEGAEDEGELLGLVELPASMNRVVTIPTEGEGFSYILLEDVILACLNSCFGSYKPTDRALIRVTRNADIDPDGEGVEEEEDYRQHMKKVLKKRLRLKPVSLTVSGKLAAGTLATIRKALGLKPKAVFNVDIPLDLGYIFAVEDKIPAAIGKEVLFEPFDPQDNPTVDISRPMRPQIEAGDKLLFYPYESMSPFLNAIHEAADDPNCISIRVTLYRVAKQSRLCESLISAVEAGKEVTVLMELRARFDEQNNIDWAERLEEAGCTVIYGSEGFKCHSKICLITYREGTTLTRITLLGTGNFNEKTAKLYSDFMLMTAHPGIGEDANLFFRNLSLGNLKGEYRFLGVAPAGLKPMIMRGLDREIDRALQGQPARVFLKLNSLTDRDVIDKIAEASCAGVQVNMIIRGISCLKPGVKGKTENVHVRQIVGRFLEHARVYAFGVDQDMIYLSSADMMTRNTEHRVEIAYPVLDPACRALVQKYMNAQLCDNVKARTLTSKGTWKKISRGEGEEPFVAQEYLMEQAIARANGEADDAEEATATAPGAEEPADAVENDDAETAAEDAEEKLEETPNEPEDGDVPTAAEAAEEVEVAEAAQEEDAPVAEEPANAAPEPAVEDKPAEKVEAELIEPEPELVSEVTTLVKAQPGRFATAFQLFKLGFKALFARRKK